MGGESSLKSFEFYNIDKHGSLATIEYNFGYVDRMQIYHPDGKGENIKNSYSKTIDTQPVFDAATEDVCSALKSMSLKQRGENRKSMDLSVNQIVETIRD